MIRGCSYPCVMQKVGEIMHQAGSGRVIIRLTSTLEEGAILCDERNERVAKVVELIGPVSGPFASALPLTNKLKGCEGKRLFAPRIPTADRRRRER